MRADGDYSDLNLSLFLSLLPPPTPSLFSSLSLSSLLPLLPFLPLLPPLTVSLQRSTLPSKGRVSFSILSSQSASQPASPCTFRRPLKNPLGVFHLADLAVCLASLFSSPSPSVPRSTPQCPRILNSPPVSPPPNPTLAPPLPILRRYRNLALPRLETSPIAAVEEVVRPAPVLPRGTS